MTTETSCHQPNRAFHLRWICCAILAGMMVAAWTVRLHNAPEASTDLEAWSWSTVFTGLFFLMAMVVFVPLLVLAIVGLQVVNPAWRDRPRWRRPTFSDNPLTLRNPLTVNHFIAQFFIAAGAGVLVSSVWNGLAAAGIGVMGLGFGLLMLVGLRWCEKVYRKQMADAPSS